MSQQYPSAPSPYGGQEQPAPIPPGPFAQQEQPQYPYQPQHPMYGMAPPTPPKKKMGLFAKIAIGVVAFLVAMAGCGLIGQLAGLVPEDDPTTGSAPTSQEPETTAPETTDPTTDPEPETTEPETQEPASEPDGTRQNPGVVGENTFVASSLDDDGELVAEPTSINWDANEIVADENMFNDEPEDGMKYIIISFDFSYTGPSSMDPYMELTITALMDGRTYDEGWQVIPNQAQDVGDLYDGGKASGDFVIMVPDDADASNTLIGVSSGWDEPIWFTAA